MFGLPLCFEGFPREAINIIRAFQFEVVQLRTLLSARPLSKSFDGLGYSTVQADPTSEPTPCPLSSMVTSSSAPSTVLPSPSQDGFSVVNRTKCKRVTAFSPFQLDSSPLPLLIQTLMIWTLNQTPTIRPTATTYRSTFCRRLTG